jgi:chemotaxis protein methyltransferase CheR
MMYSITSREFRSFQQLIYDSAGIFLSDAKQALLVGRLTRRLRALRLRTFSDYYRYILEGEAPHELEEMLNCVSTNETRFFREKRQFDYLESTVFPAWSGAAASGERRRHIAVWSAGCSTGEEPYSLAMALLAHFPSREGWQIDILASDLSTRVLARAREAEWPIAKANEIPPCYLKAFMLKGTGPREGTMKASPALREVIRFERINLNEERYPVKGRFDLIFCRNVLIYFSAAAKKRVIERLLDHVAPGGYFAVGHAETLYGLTTRAHAVVPTIYRPA